jgi:hypothetical protein
MAFPPFLTRISAVFGSRRKGGNHSEQMVARFLVLLLRSADVLLILSPGSGNVNNRLLAYDFQAEALPKGKRTLMSVSEEVPVFCGRIDSSLLAFALPVVVSDRPTAHLGRAVSHESVERRDF